MNKRKPHILYLGETGFPVGYAAIQRQILIAKGLVEAGCQVTVISFKGKHGKSTDFPPSGNFEGIDYIYTSGNIYKPQGFLNRNWQKLLGKWRELKLIRSLKKEGKLDACLITTMDIDSLVLYWLWLKIVGIPFVLDLVELNSSIDSRSGTWEKINDRLFDRFAVKMADGVAPISDYLKKHSQKLAPGTRIQKIPIICDFDAIMPSPAIESETRFLYCGSPSYLQLIKFVLEAFEKLEVTGKPIFLHIIMGGSPSDIEKANEIIAQSKNYDNIRAFPNILREGVITQYDEASALLIPLRPTLQDEARFPHKIGEYLASAKPVITTAFGEINHYDFIDQETALVAKGYDSHLFAEKMKYVLEHPEKAREIGKQGRELGLKNFDYKDLGRKMKDILLNKTVSKTEQSNSAYQTEQHKNSVKERKQQAINTY